MGDKKELACLYNQEKTVEKIFGIATVIEDEAIVFAELDLIARINQGDDGQLLKIVKGEDEGYAETNLQHVDEMLEKCLLETFKQEKEVADTRMKLPKAVEELGADTSLQNLSMLTSIQGGMSGYVTAVREIKDNLIFKGKFAGDEKKEIFAEGQEVWEATTIGEMTAKATLVAATESGSSSSRQSNF